MIVAQRTDESSSPRLSMGAAPTHLIENRGDPRVRLNPSQRANDFDKVCVGHISVLAIAKFLQLQLRVVAALPMQHQTNGVLFRGGDNLLERDAQNALLMLGRAERVIP